MQESIARQRLEVHSAFDSLLAYADADERRSFGEFEGQLWSLLLGLGRLLVALFLARQAFRPRSTEYQHHGIRYRLVGERSSMLGTVFGKVTFCRPVGRRPESPRAACDLPVDRELGLCSGFSLGVVMTMSRLCALMAYAGARETFRYFLEWAPSPRAVLRMVDAIGGKARAFLEQSPPPDEDGDVLVIQVDGKGAPMISKAEYELRCRAHERVEGVTGRKARRIRRRRRQRPRWTEGTKKKSKNAKMAIVGVLYTLQTTKEGMEGPIAKRVYATFESHEALFIWLRHEADKRGYGTKECFFLGDGSLHIWRLQKRYFPEAEVCLDWFHVVERLWDVGGCMYHKGSDEQRKWVSRQADSLRRGAADEVLEALKEQLKATPRKGPGNKAKREMLHENITFFTNHLSQMRYAEMRARDLDIGTGAVEGAVRNLVGMRLDGPGMRWGRRRAELVLHLRCILLNSQWADFTQYIASLPAFTLSSQPATAIPHTAKRVA